MSSDKIDSAVSWNKMNLTLPCGNLTFYSSRLSSNRSNVGKIELVFDRPIASHFRSSKSSKRNEIHSKPSYNNIYPILHSLDHGSSMIMIQHCPWSWIMRKSKSRTEGMVFTARKMYPLGSQTKRHRKPKFCVHLSYYIIWRDFVCCWHIRSGYKVQKV